MGLILNEWLVCFVWKFIVQDYLPSLSVIAVVTASVPVIGIDKVIEFATPTPLIETVIDSDPSKV